jgi:hypothetical protein
MAFDLPCPTCGTLGAVALQKALKAQAQASTMNQMSRLGMAVHVAHDQYRRFPPYYGVYGPPGKNKPSSFHTHLLNWVDQELYNQKVPNPTAIVVDYLSPMDSTRSADGAGAANFAVNLRLYYTKGGLGTLSSGADLIYPTMLGSFDDGTSNTLLFATKYQNCGMSGGSMWADANAPNSQTAATFGASMALWQAAPPQAAPPQAACDPTVGTAVSFTAPSIQVAMCDASVTSVKSEVWVSTWQAAHTPGEREPPAGPDLRQD